MLSEAEIKEEALRLDQAESGREQDVATTSLFPNIGVEEAYAIQRAWVDHKMARGQKVIGYKIGLTSKVMQKSMQIDEPDYGTLLDGMMFQNGQEIAVQNFLDPRIEVELAFKLKKTLSGPTLSVDEVLDATDYIVPALELIAARTYRIDPKTGYVRNVRDTISDNAANAGIICGDEKIDPQTTDLRWIGSLLYKNGVIEESGVSAAVLDHPANGLIWLARKYDSYGVSLEPGQIILAGSFTRPIKVVAGDLVVADFEKFGKITTCFV